MHFFFGDNQASAPFNPSVIPSKCALSFEQGEQPQRRRPPTTVSTMDNRSARLAALAAKAGRSSQQPSIDGGGHDQEDTSSSKPTITFRNYAPKDPSLDNAGALSLDAEILSTNKRQKRSTSEKTTKPTALELALAKTSRESREAAGQNVGTNRGWGSISAVATKKVNWDLKRDVQHRLDRLEKRTQRAIVELLRERLEREAGEVANDDDEGEGDSDLNKLYNIIIRYIKIKREKTLSWWIFS